MGWLNCDPVLSDVTTTFPGIYPLYVSVTGIAELHKGYRVEVIYGDPFDQVPDAWRFDEAGCYTPAFLSIKPAPPPELAGSCPPFSQGALGLDTEDVNFVPPGGPWSQSLMRLVLARSYPAGVPSVNPATRYHLVGFHFDHSFSVVGPSVQGLSCGNFERPMCFRLVRSAYVTMEGLEVPFANSNVVHVVTFNGVGACPATIALPKTWGSIRAQYRN